MIDVGVGVLANARRECEQRLATGDDLPAVERYIDALPVSPDARAALWLWAWAWEDRSSRARPV